MDAQSSVTMITTKLFAYSAILLCAVSIKNNAEATPDAPCTDLDPSNCTAPAEQCTSGTCSCSGDYYGNGGVCNLRLDFDADCQISTKVQQCKVPFSCVNTGTAIKCLCGDGLYHDGSGNCQLVNSLKPTFQMVSSTSNSITIRLTAKPPVPSPYSSMYTASIYSTKAIPNNQTTHVNENNDTVLGGLYQGHAYFVTVTRTIVIYGWQKVPSPKETQVISTKSGFSQYCTTAGDCKTEDGGTFVCRYGRCLCAAGTYFTGNLPCQDINSLNPTFQIVSSNNNSITIQLNKRPPIPNYYTGSYTAHINPGAFTRNVNQSSDTVLGGLAEGTLYSITITTTIFQFGWRTTSPTVSHSFSTKSRFIQICGSDGDCKVEGGSTFVCRAGHCVCAAGSYYTGSLPCQDINNLRPTFEIRSSDMNTITIRLINKPSTLPQYTSSYIANLKPGALARNVNEHGDTVLGGLVEGTRYSITITRTLDVGQVGWQTTTSPTDPQIISTSFSVNDEDLF